MSKDAPAVASSLSSSILPEGSGIRRDLDVAIVPGSTPFVLTCQIAPGYQKWEGALRYAVEEYKTWSSFRRSENVMEYFKSHVGESVRFLKGVAGARHDGEALWEEMREVEVMKISKETFQTIEKSSRKVEAWHGVAEEIITRTHDDVAFLSDANTSDFAMECRASDPFSLWEESIKKAVLKYGKSWETFRRSGGINCYFWKELGDDRRMLRARNKNATSDQDADWEVLCGEPLTALMEKKFRYYACVLEEPKEEPKEEEVQAADSQAGQDLSNEENNTNEPGEAKKRKPNSDDSSDTDQQSKKRAKPNSSDALVDAKSNHANGGNLHIAHAKPPPSRKLVCSVFVLSKSLALTLGRIDVKIKTKWKLDRLRADIDPVLRKKNFLTLGVAWEFYFYDSGSFVSQALEDNITIDQYLLEANQENAISIRVVP